MIFAVSNHSYYFKYCDGINTYTATYDNCNTELRNGFSRDIFEAMINYCLDVGTYDININNNIATCIFICDTNQVKQRFQNSEISYA